MVKKTPFVAIDLGSNSIRLICGSPQTHPQNSLKICLRKLRIVRLGEGFEPDGYLKPTAMERAIQVLKELISQFRGYSFDHIRMVTTGVVREAKNQGEFLERVKREVGIQSRVLKGEEEAALTLLGVRSTIKGLTMPLFICDIGGGSTEFAIQLSDSTEDFFSIPIGVIRLAERFGISAPISEDSEKEMNAYIKINLIKLLGPFPKIATFVATAGTPTTLASIDQTLKIYDPIKVHGYILRFPRLREIYEHLKVMNLKQRRKISGLECGREDIIVPGTAILLCVMEKFDIKSLIVSEGGLLEGVLAQTYKTSWGVMPQIFL
jgi:exopolyphosphatase/guanosine-5'-triphosphate,3'-diphosphate pyrophosphatase